MIVKRYLKKRKDGKKLYKTYSDNNFYIKKVETGEIFEEAIDVEGNNFDYEETSIQIGDEEDTEEINGSLL